MRDAAEWLRKKNEKRKRDAALEEEKQLEDIIVDDFSSKGFDSAAKAVKKLEDEKRNKETSRLREGPLYK
jgi:hypothetical protein